ncbi:MAG: nucleotidyl transferase AbiEii/AbiGii toxin family protein [Intrasporangium sp.]|uniref:nucleotidyl transferase AbiEii/AbiGii toxin family protein n=1 Tax=Intrasporangium sp. TaxID=1925024 RepID=UPI0026481390|nr:nucleotidyl transferase AbiEii/AbiGii toxin family protein [Intrasporangium sp.]MDN5794788.1 nucleotidyl transferase AbiEii/AbiGii toxin family protein [Intrasporangium sp.]
MAEPEPYSTPRGVENAIKDAARSAAAADPSLDVNKRIQLEYFNRFLSRVFSEAEDSDWVLKGGTGMLARVPSTRATRDIDLYRRGFTLTQALDDLIRLAAIDLGDHFRFQYVSHTQSIGNDTQPYTEGYQVRFEILIGLSTKGSLQVDLAVGTGITGEVTTTDPANAPELPPRRDTSCGPPRCGQDDSGWVTCSLPGRQLRHIVTAGSRPHAPARRRPCGPRHRAWRRRARGGS